MKKERKKKSKRLKLIIIIAVAVFSISGFALIRAVSAGKSEPPPETTVLRKTDLTSSISLSGVVKSASTTNIYSNQNYPVKEIYFDVGDKVEAGDILAVLDMSKLETDIKQAEKNLESAVLTAQENNKTISNNIKSASVSLESSRVSLERQLLSTQNAERDLLEARSDLSEPFDSYTYDLAINEAKVNLDRRNEELQNAEEELDEALNNFDSYSYDTAINEAKVTLEKRIAELDEAKSDLLEELSKQDEPFDEYSYLYAIENAKLKYERCLDDYYTAENDYNCDPTDLTYSVMQVAERTLADARAAVDKAETDLEKAREDYNKTIGDAKTDKIKAAEKAVENAQKNCDDAERNYNKTVTDLERAMNDAAENALEKRDAAQKNVDDARRNYEKASSDKQKAIEDYLEKNRAAVESAEKVYEDSKKQLESAQVNEKSAQNSLEQAQSKTDTSGVNIDLQELNVEKLNTQLAEGKIVATASGVITEKNIKEGAQPTGILFVIEDCDDLYVSARIKEYNLASVKEGLEAVVTADATGDKEYEGVISYISPKAVSEAGSTSVEFEIRAALQNPDPDIKIGMNAFLNIVTETKEDIFAAPLSIIVTNEEGDFVYAWENEEKLEIPVKLGLSTSTLTEIVGEGLYDGIELLVDPENKLSDGNAPRSPWG